MRMHLNSACNLHSRLHVFTGSLFSDAWKQYVAASALKNFGDSRLTL